MPRNKSYLHFENAHVSLKQLGTFNSLVGFSSVRSQLLMAHGLGQWMSAYYVGLPTVIRVRSTRHFSRYMLLLLTRAVVWSFVVLANKHWRQLLLRWCTMTAPRKGGTTLVKRPFTSTRTVPTTRSAWSATVDRLARWVGVFEFTRLLSWRSGNFK